jgi:hypothetical protein
LADADEIRERLEKQLDLGDRCRALRHGNDDGNQPDRLPSRNWFAQAAARWHRLAWSDGVRTLIRCPPCPGIQSILDSCYSIWFTEECHMNRLFLHRRYAFGGIS